MEAVGTAQSVPLDQFQFAIVTVRHAMTTYDRQGFVSTPCHRLGTRFTVHDGSYIHLAASFRIFDENGSGSVDFREFVISLWNYCTLSKAALVIFAFDLYDNDNSGGIDVHEVELLLKEVYGQEFRASTQAQTIMTKLRGGHLGPEKIIDINRFREFCRTHPAVLYPAFVLQTQMQGKIMGHKFWDECSRTRVELSNGTYIKISELLHAHINEKVCGEGKTIVTR